MSDKAQELLHYASNKYELVLNVARRAKNIRDDAMSASIPEANKPIGMALREIAEQQRKDRDTSVV
jgi:DNA-directed RNA polymerase omega subunit